MKTNYSKLLLFLIVILGSCVAAELDSIQAFRYTFPELENVVPLPEVIPIPPAAVTTSIGQISITKESEELVVNVVEAVIQDNLTEDNITIIERFAEIAPEVPTEVLISVVTESWILGVLDGSVTPTTDFKKIADFFKNDAEFVKFLTQLEFPKINGFPIGGRLDYSISGEIVYSTVEHFEISSLNIPCKNEAEKFYSKNIDILESQASSQKEEIKVFYDGFRTQVNALYNTRLDVKDRLISENLNDLRNFAVFFNAAVDELDYPEEIIRGLKIYIIAFVLEIRVQVLTYEKAYLLFAEREKEQNLILINLTEAAKNAEINANLKSGKDEQKRLYNNAVNNCHNQGAGGG